MDLSGLVIRITGPEADFSREHVILGNFLVEPQPWDWEITFRMADVLPEIRGVCVFSGGDREVYRDGDRIITWIGLPGRVLENPQLCIIRGETASEAILKRSPGCSFICDRDLALAMEAEHLIVSSSGILLHSSQICHRGEAIVFTAPSGTGKSTQADLWNRYRGAEIINGDRSGIRVREDGVWAYGVPFCGSSNIRRRSCLPLKAIVCLEQASETRICRLRGRQAFRLLWEGCSFHTWNKESVEKCADTVMQILQFVPVYLLACRPDESAVEALEGMLESEVE